jgi:hypothetical protein
MFIVLVKQYVWFNNWTIRWTLVVIDLIVVVFFTWQVNVTCCFWNCINYINVVIYISAGLSMWIPLRTIEVFWNGPLYFRQCPCVSKFFDVHIQFDKVKPLLRLTYLYLFTLLVLSIVSIGDFSIKI